MRVCPMHLFYRAGDRYDFGMIKHGRGVVSRHWISAGCQTQESRKGDNSFERWFHWSSLRMLKSKSSSIYSPNGLYSSQVKLLIRGNPITANIVRCINENRIAVL